VREDRENSKTVRTPTCQMPVTRIGLRCRLGGIRVEGPRLRKAISTKIDHGLIVVGREAVPWRWTSTTPLAILEQRLPEISFFDQTTPSIPFLTI
jgi:hypothetical protein